MVRIQNLTKSFGPRVLFQNISVSINPGERLGLVGRNGHGKTTKLKRGLRKGGYADVTNAATVKRMIPYK